MKNFFKYRTTIHPIIAIFTSLFIFFFGLFFANRVYVCLYFLLACYFWLLLLGCFRGCIHTLPFVVILVLIFGSISYFTTKSIEHAIIMSNRVLATIFAIIPGFSTSAVDTTRCLSSMKVNRGVILGMLIVMSFFPLLFLEIKRVREAMKTRGAGSIFKPKIFYRAFLIPLIVRLTNITDLLTLSVETRGYSLEKAPYTIYKKCHITLYDILIIFGILTGVMGMLFVNLR